MFRVTPITEDHEVRLHVEGRLSGAAELDVLREALAEAESHGRRVVVELSGLRFADHRAVSLLAGAAERGAKLVGCSSWLSSLIGGGR
jgi:anti-anti-sigma regulatory factor